MKEVRYEKLPENGREVFLFFSPYFLKYGFSAATILIGFAIIITIHHFNHITLPMPSLLVFLLRLNFSESSSSANQSVWSC